MMLTSYPRLNVIESNSYLNIYQNEIFKYNIKILYIYLFVVLIILNNIIYIIMIIK